MPTLQMKRRALVSVLIYLMRIDLWISMPRGKGQRSVSPGQVGWWGALFTCHGPAYSLLHYWWQYPHLLTEPWCGDLAGFLRRWACNVLFQSPIHMKHCFRQLKCIIEVDIKKAHFMSVDFICGYQNSWGWIWMVLDPYKEKIENKSPISYHIWK